MASPEGSTSATSSNGREAVGGEEGTPDLGRPELRGLPAARDVGHVQIREPEGKGRPSFSIRQEFAKEWMFAVKPITFVNRAQR